MQLLPGPKVPATIQVLNWIFRPMPYMVECAKTYGDLFTLKLQSSLPPLLFVHSPEAMQQILSNDHKDLEAPGDLNSIFEYLLGKNSVITLSGKSHQRQRQLIMPPFHGERMRTYAEIIENITIKTINKQPKNQPFNIRNIAQNITLGIMMEAVFGIYEGERPEKLKKLLCEIIEQSSSRLSVTFLYFPKLKEIFGISEIWKQQMKKLEEADQIIYQEIQERRENFDPSRTDILTLLMAARDEEGQPMTDEELRDELMTLLVAGHETTATAISWAFYWIHKLPEVREKLLAELDSLGENPDSNTIFKLPYLTAVCNETLRIYPVGMLTFPRKVKTPISVCGQQLEPGTIIIGSIYLTHQREDIYPQPEKFNPERFLEKQFSPYEFLPFGGGARRCIGLAFAQMEMKLILAKVMKTWSMQLINTQEIKPQRRGLVTGPNAPINLVIENIRQPISANLETATV
ncbi:cytochrome P450 [Dolichospermum sp. ST_con]|nr:cytochrome P450 [Dolichospermum sp. ST_con]MDD1420482.1 cytochrome P450 [Dolichospermum sp. ST_sed1]MDD1425031.1 cytochrome P450 [Dolichospermum sp. ST_sed9]MDD1431682.1 cytochrome P450 [Dolichospermum sp. ST_sed6]MDD1436424.1 cytochrome P450 [Dolichospermum sp. ST_sed10]MDD1440359.1 cytochrome P450 [Dolichospermum sp. ST_sed3]MDD1448798.1 cytochrome P450 [Dolichospermum sp. ST_sed8]MDD1456344.1 cytochrome P450 [Dolichospermum sp. ST_sed7]MDD1461854.1 cytochrome P450 [Dolichospermum sp. 